MKLLWHEFEGYAQYGLSDIIKKCTFGVPKIFGILFGKYFELRKSTWASQRTYIRVSDSQIWRFNSKVHLRYYYFCPKFVKNCSKTAWFCMASLLAIYGDRESCKIMIKVVFVISVDDIKHNEACLTTKNGNSKNLLSCLEALYTSCKPHLWKMSKV